MKLQKDISSAVALCRRFRQKLIVLRALPQSREWQTPQEIGAKFMHIELTPDRSILIEPLEIIILEVSSPLLY